MIRSIKGTIIEKSEKYLVVEAAGIGYQVFVTLETSEKFPEGATALLWTHQAVREDSISLFGFETKSELELFELLLTVSGIGPKTALGILSLTTPQALKKAVSSGDGAHLHKVFGIGKKVADKIVLELKGKVGEEEKDSSELLKEEVDALEALKSLGYGHREAREALQQISKEIAGTHDRIKEALKLLGR